MELFKVFMKEEVKKQQFVTPMLVLLSNIAKYIPPTRAVMYSLLFPKEIKEREDMVKPPPEIKGTFAEKLISLLFSHSDTLRIFCGEFLWEVCGEEASNLSRTIGFGNAAGYLSYKGMLKMFNPQSDSPDPNLLQSDSPNLLQSPPSNTSSTTSPSPSSSNDSKFQEIHFNDVEDLHKTRKNENVHHKEPTEEEIKEWEELMEKLERLEKLGIKMHFQTDKKDEEKK